MKIFILSIFLIISLNIFAQTGPAGVGSSTSNILWVRSEDLSSLSDGDRIATWADNSGNSNDLTQSDNSYKPEYKTNVQNGFPVVRFNQTNNRLIKNSFSDFPTSGISVFMVNKTSSSTDGLFSYNTSTQDNEFLLFNSNALKLFRRGSQSSSSLDFNDDSWHIIDASWKSSGGNLEICKDNDFSSSHTATLSNGTDIVSGGCLAIAAEQDTIDGGYETSQYHNGDFLEIIVYNTALNTAQKIIVSNYLAAKYNLTISNDFYAYQASYSHELAGIGRFDASNTHISAQSADLITIDSASAMSTNGEYLLFAHDNGSISSWSSTGSAYNTQKIAREWRFDETGDVGTIDITLNEDDLAALPSGYTKYGIMIDSDGDFTSGASVYELAISGSDYEVRDVDIADGDYLCIVAIKPSVQFNPTSGEELENNNASATVELNYLPTTAVSVDYSTSNGTASSGSDYTAISATTLNFSAGTQSQDISATITDDASTESDEDFTINLSNPSTGLNLGTNSTFTHTILDNDNTRKIYFSAATSSASESTTSVNITVEINQSDGSNATTADYTVTGGTASGGGTDYTLANGTASISSGNTTTNISITINNDALDEDNETIIIELSNASSNCNLSNTDPIEHTYTINDDDATPTIYFTNTTSSALESVSSKNIEVKISAVSSKDISVSFAASGTATSGTDYDINTSSPITITAGNTTKNISLSITDENAPENDETVILTLSGPTNATLGTNKQYTYTITDDDKMGYDGPGGVGESSVLKIWVKAEDIPGSSDGDRIGSWADKSGNGNDLAQTDATYKPYYYDNVVNGYPVMRCKTDDRVRLVKTSFADFPTSEITEYIVRQTSINFYGELSYATTNNSNEFLFFNYTDNLRVFRAGANRATGVTPPSTWTIAATSWRNSDNALKVIINGDEYTGTLSSVDDIVQGGCFSVGAEQDAVNNNYETRDDFEGDIAEVFIYNKVLSNAQRNIVNNYLSAKYNITMDDNDKYVGDNSGNGNYDFEVIGIGTESDGLHEEAHGSGGLWIKQASNFGNGDYLLIGHNEINPQIYTPDDDAGMTAVSIEERWGRDWYFDITDAESAITVDLTFDFTEAEMNSSSSPAGTTTNYKLLYRSGTSGNWKIVSSASSKTASQILFTGQALSDGDGHYALGTIDATASPLPVELLSFEATKIKRTVELNWKTATEINNDYFEIQHSENTKDWELIGIVDGNGNSNEIISYNFTHQNPNNGVNYYRLKQVDFDGKFSFSQIKSVTIGNTKHIEIYPNPSNGLIHITNITSNSKIELLDMNSRVINIDVQYNDGEAILNLDRLPKSIYFIRVISSNRVETYRVIKN